jgi:hypothetical protein
VRCPANGHGQVDDDAEVRRAIALSLAHDQGQQGQLEGSQVPAVAAAIRDAIRDASACERTLCCCR